LSEIITQRSRELYKLKGYPDDWIEKWMRSIAIREEYSWQCLEGIGERKWREGNYIRKLFTGSYRKKGIEKEKSQIAIVCG
jgi:hypothetical protein